MAEANSSSNFTSPDSRFGPALLGALLRRPLEVVRERMLERLHEHGFADLEPTHLHVLQYPGPEGKRPSELAALLRISKQALNYQLGQLERLGYLARLPDADDLRSRRIALTPRAEAAVPVIRDAVAEIETEWRQQLGSERFDQLRNALVELNRLI